MKIIKKLLLIVLALVLMCPAALAGEKNPTNSGNQQLRESTTPGVIDSGSQKPGTEQDETSSDDEMTGFQEYLATDDDDEDF